jgi:CO dehydrogenase/acetyl-CoA synthase beta subunit
MTNFTEIRSFIEKKKLNSQNFTIWNLAPDLDHIITRGSSKFRLGKGAWKGVFVDESEIQLELGSENYPSTAMVLYNSDPKLIHNARITLIGPDLPAIKQNQSVFGLIVMIGSSLIESKDMKKIRNLLYISDSIEGVQLRSNPRKYWLRIGKEIYNKGVSFLDIGRSFLILFKTAFPALIETIELFFFTTSNQDIEELALFEKNLNQIYTNALRAKIAKYLKVRTDCDFEWECQSCEYQSICNEVREIIALRNEKMNNTE